MSFARRVFTWAGIYGLLILLPQYFIEERFGLDNPPPITHPEFYYGFTGVALAWQIAFLIIGRDPARYRPMMIPGILEKCAFGFANIALFAQGRLGGLMLFFGLIDLLWAASFAVAFVRTPRG